MTSTRTPTPASSGRALQDACEQIQRATQELTHITEVDQWHAAVEGVHRITGALSELVDTLTDIAPGAFGRNGHRDIGDELLRDLRAARGCLTTTSLLVAPAVDDLHQLASGRAATKPRTRRVDRRLPTPAPPEPPAVAIIDGNAVPLTPKSRQPKAE